MLESPVRSRRAPEIHDAGLPVTSPAGSADAHARGLAIAALAVIAVTHWVDLPDKIAEAPYMAALFIGNIVASLVLAGLLIAGRMTQPALQGGALLSLLTLIGYVLSRSIGLPQIEDHVGHWLDPAGVAAALAEIAMLGLALPSLQAHLWRLAAFVAVPMVAYIGVALAAGQTFEGHSEAHEHGAAGHQHGAAHQHAAAHQHGAAHQHAAGHHHGPQYPNLAAASQADRDRAAALLRTVQENARLRFPTYAAALHAGYTRVPSGNWQRPLAFHLRHSGYERDGREIDPVRPESLVYWWPPDGQPTLLAMMFRTDRRPAFVGSVPIFHRHVNLKTGDTGTTMMMHVWLTHDLRTAFANCLPQNALERENAAFRYTKPRPIQALETLPCSKP
jgi:hypothetical protein